MTRGGLIGLAVKKSVLSHRFSIVAKKTERGAADVSAV